MLLDLKYALSQLRRNIGIPCAIVLTMAIGMAVTTGIYAIVNGVLIRPLPYRDQERLVVLWESTKDTPRFVVAPANFLDWKRQSATFSDMTAIRQFKERSFAMTGAGDPEEFDGVRVTWNVFDVLGVGSIQGRLFRPQETTAQEGRTARSQASQDDVCEPWCPSLPRRVRLLLCRPPSVAAWSSIASQEPVLVAAIRLN